MPMPKSTGFAGLSKGAKPAAGLQAQAEAEIKATAKPAAAAPAPVKTRAQLLREEAEAAEREEQAAMASAEVVHEAVHEPETAPVAKPAPRAAAPAAQPAPVAKPAPATSRAVAAPAAPSGFGLSTDRKKMASALMAFVEVAEQTRAPSLFPALECTGGEGGGMWASPSWQDPEVAQTLPQGKVAQKMFYLGYRVSVIIWPKEYNKAVKAKPVAAGIVTGADAELCAIATRAAKNYQFTKPHLKDRFDIDNGGPGRPTVGVEVIGYMPNTDRAGNVLDGGQLVVLQGVVNYGSAARTLGELARLVDPKIEEIPNLPMLIAIDTAQESSAAKAWPTHYFTFATDVTSVGVAVAKSFEAFQDSAKQDAELMAKFDEWMTGGDRKLAPEDIERLKIAASL
jgi:hypothetical protein